MKITVIRDDGKAYTLRSINVEMLMEQMKTEIKAQPVSKLREVLPYLLPGDSCEQVRKVPKLLPAAVFTRKDGVMVMSSYEGLVMIEVNHLSGRTEVREVKERVKELPQTFAAFTGSSGRSVKAQFENLGDLVKILIFVA